MMKYKTLSKNTCEFVIFFLRHLSRRRFPYTYQCNGPSFYALKFSLNFSEFLILTVA